MTTEQTQAVSGSRRSVILDFLGSMNLAITILVIVAIASVIGTVLQQNQDYNDYIIKFGPFWHEYFKFLRLYDVYGAMWFLLLLAFLVTSTSVCIYRNVPTMLQEMRNFRLNSQLKALRTMENAQTWQVEQDEQTLMDRLRRFLSVNGYASRVKQHEDRVVIAGMRGKFNRIGYLMAHMGIVVICLGAFLNAKFDLTVREWLGKLKLVPNSAVIQDIRDVPAISTLKPGEAFAFRGNSQIPEGKSVNYTILNIRDGWVLQQLPFSIELKQFRVEQYNTGQPKSFESDLVIHDSRLKEPLKKTISVNHPLVYRGYNIYQASFGDGGSHLTMKLWPFYDAKLRTLDLTGTVGENRTLDTMHGQMTLEFADFKKFNVFPAPKDDPQHRKFENFGPSIIFRVRDDKGVAKEYVNYMSPVKLGGRYFFITGTRNSVSEDYRYIHIPADDKFTVDRFMKFEAALNDAPRVTRIARDTVDRLMQSAPSNQTEMKATIVKSMVDLADRFLFGGYEAIDAQIRKITSDSAQQQKMADAYTKVLTSLLQAVYSDVLKDEGVKSEKDITPAQERFYFDAVEALRQIYLYGSPFYVQLTDFQQVQQSTLQVTRSPGNIVLYLGCAMLIAGVFLLFYVSHQRLWLVLYRDEAGTQQLLFAGSGNRNASDFRTHYHDLADRLNSLLKA
ncbi:MAG: cytochrome c biogenesis protein ResB [Gammaproteobacteria bacterium]|nr:cytochrome c biogenesis protein ResB [Gammaproteobacteria bacterium]